MHSNKIWCLLNELENKINTEKCWIDLLVEHCSYKEYNTDSLIFLILNEIEECNKKAFKEIEDFYTKIYKY